MADYGECFVRDGSVVLTHGASRVVVQVLLKAACQGKHFSVVVRIDATRPRATSTSCVSICCSSSRGGESCEGSRAPPPRAGSRPLRSRMQ